MQMAKEDEAVLGYGTDPAKLNWSASYLITNVAGLLSPDNLKKLRKWTESRSTGKITLVGQPNQNRDILNFEFHCGLALPVHLGGFPNTKSKLPSGVYLCGEEGHHKAVPRHLLAIPVQACSICWWILEKSFGEKWDLTEEEFRKYGSSKQLSKINIHPESPAAEGLGELFQIAVAHRRKLLETEVSIRKRMQLVALLVERLRLRSILESDEPELVAVMADEFAYGQSSFLDALEKCLPAWLESKGISE